MPITSTVSASTNNPYQNRIALNLDTYVGPLTQNGILGAFNPARDIQVYVNGVLFITQTSIFDVLNNRYLLYMAQPFNLQGIIQVVHHAPKPPFLDLTETPLLGFALIISYFTSDVLLTDFIVQEDGISLFLLENNSGALLLET